MPSTIDKVIMDQFAELISKYDGLRLFYEADAWTIEGVLSFSATYEGIAIEDEYEVKITLPKDYPETPPTAKEIGGRIPKDFHKNDDELLCLAAPLKIRILFAKNPTLIGFIDNLLIKYLYSYSYFVKNGSMPFGELSHGGKGIMEQYQEIFEIYDSFSIAELLWILINGYKGHYYCPCHSGKRLRNCHGSTLLNIKKYQPNVEFICDLYYVMKSSGIRAIPQKYKSIFMNANIKKILISRKMI